MDVVGLASFLASIGHRIRSVGGAYWYDAFPYIYSPLPYELEIEPSQVNWGELYEGKCLGARCASVAPWGRPSFRLIVDSPNYNLDSLTSKARNQTRRGLEYCNVRPLEFTDLAESGLQLQRDTLRRQGRRIPANLAEKWRSYVQAAAVSDGAAAWGAFHKDTLAAFLVGLQVNQTIHILIVRSSAATLQFYPNNALIFSFVQQALKIGVAQEVSIGFESIQSGIESLDKFKEGLGFRRRPTYQYVHVTPRLGGIIRGPLGATAINLLNWLPKSENTSKAIGLMRWYRSQESISI